MPRAPLPDRVLRRRAERVVDVRDGRAEDGGRVAVEEAEVAEDAAQEPRGEDEVARDVGRGRRRPPDVAAEARAVPEEREEPGREKGAKFPTSKAPISVVFRSFRLIFGRAIISRSALEAWALFSKRARAEHSR